MSINFDISVLDNDIVKFIIDGDLLRLKYQPSGVNLHHGRIEHQWILYELVKNHEYGVEMHVTNAVYIIFDKKLYKIQIEYYRHPLIYDDAQLFHMQLLWEGINDHRIYKTTINPYYMRNEPERLKMEAILKLNYLNRLL